MLCIKLPDVFKYMVPFKPINVQSYEKIMYAFFDDEQNIDSIGESAAYLSLSLTELSVNPFSVVANNQLLNTLKMMAAAGQSRALKYKLQFAHYQNEYSVQI